jgi:cytochrome P450
MVSFLENRPLLGQHDEARDLLDLLRTARDQGSGGPFEAEVIVDQVGTMMAAGFETTAVALFWIALLLAFFPNHQEAIRGELCTQSVDAPPEAQFLPFTTAFVYEALRLYPPVYNFSRQAAVDDCIGDLSIPRGATITISPWVLHRHQRHWEHPHRFDPRRFFRDGRIVVPKMWMPFGAGPRRAFPSAIAWISTEGEFPNIRNAKRFTRLKNFAVAGRPIGALMEAFA